MIGRGGGGEVWDPIVVSEIDFVLPWEMPANIQILKL